MYEKMGAPRTEISEASTSPIPARPPILIIARLSDAAIAALMPAGRFLLRHARTRASHARMASTRSERMASRSDALGGA